MDERALVLLRRKLEALNYTEALDSASAPLVSHIVNDLIRTTDTYRSVKQQASKYAQEIATFNTKVRSSSSTGTADIHGLLRGCCAWQQANHTSLVQQCNNSSELFGMVSQQQHSCGCLLIATVYAMLPNSLKLCARMLAASARRTASFMSS
jgi:hypothetical protein